MLQKHSQPLLLLHEEAAAAVVVVVEEEVEEVDHLSFDCICSCSYYYWQSLLILMTCLVG